MKGKEVVKFLLLRDAFTSRNVTSFGLVLFFFFVYYLSGGKVTWIPKSPNLQGVNPARFQALDTTTAPVADDTAPAAKVAPQPIAPILQEEPKREAPPAAVDSGEESPGSSERLRALRERLQNMKTKQQGDAGK